MYIVCSRDKTIYFFLLYKEQLSEKFQPFWSEKLILRHKCMSIFFKDVDLYVNNYLHIDKRKTPTQFLSIFTYLFSYESFKCVVEQYFVSIYY